jgi:hypothetical protein
MLASQEHQVVHQIVSVVWVSAPLMSTNISGANTLELSFHRLDSLWDALTAAPAIANMSLEQSIM